MQLLNCPNQELLFEFVSIPEELPLWRRLVVRLHVLNCAGCQKKITSLQEIWQNYFRPEPDITSSLMRVYSKLQNDETLILKGWKIGETHLRRSWESLLFKEGWLFRGGVGVALTAIFGLVVYNQVRGGGHSAAPSIIASRHTRLPLAQIRMENKNSVRVQYLQPELLQSIEFETTSGR